MLSSQAIRRVRDEDYQNGRGRGYGEAGVSVALSRPGDGRDRGRAIDAREVPGALRQSRTVPGGDGGVRWLAALGAASVGVGHEVRRLPAKTVRPFVGGNKNDAQDACSIWTAAQQSGVKTVAIKSGGAAGGPGAASHASGAREGLNKCLLHFSDAQGESALSALLTVSVTYRHRKWWHIPVPREPLINQRFPSEVPERPDQRPARPVGRIR